MKAQLSIQERFLAELCRDKTFLRIFLTSGVRLEGTIKSFDQYVLYMEEPTPQIIYKSAICSIVVGQPKQYA